MNISRLTEYCVTACATVLPDWKLYNRNTLYRCNTSFVQWLTLEQSDKAVRIVPAYSIQALAEQFVFINLTCGGRINNKNGENLWIYPDDWNNQKSFMLKLIIEQIIPPVQEPLSIKAIRNFLEDITIQNPSVYVAKAVACIEDDAIEQGQFHFEKALGLYSGIKAQWAIEEKERVASWLKNPGNKLLQTLRNEARQGAKLLKIAVSHCE